MAANGEGKTDDHYNDFAQQYKATQSLPQYSNPRIGLIWSLLLSFVPWWLRFLLMPNAWPRAKAFVQDLGTAAGILGGADGSVLTVFRNIYGEGVFDQLPPEANSEKAFNFTTIRNLLYLLLLDIVFVFPGFIIASLPIVCALLPLYDVVNQLAFSDRLLFSWIPLPKGVHAFVHNVYVALGQHSPHHFLFGTNNDPVPDEKVRQKWFFLNGMYNTEDFARKGAARLSQIFGVYVNLIFRPSRGFFRDIFECYIGRSFGWPTIPALLARLEILEHIRDPNVDKVVIIGHSQGTIVTAEMTEFLLSENPGDGRGPLQDDELKKIEIYLLACCAASIPPQFVRFGRVEFFGNSLDPVYQLSRPITTTQIPRFTAVRIGHLLNAHYLFDITQANVYKHIAAGPGKPQVSQLLQYLKHH